MNLNESHAGVLILTMQLFCNLKFFQSKNGGGKGGFCTAFKPKDTHLFNSGILQQRTNVQTHHMTRCSFPVISHLIERFRSSSYLWKLLKERPRDHAMPSMFSLKKKNNNNNHLIYFFKLSTMNIPLATSLVICTHFSQIYLRRNE